MKYQLTKELETGNSIIDQEHRQLFQAVNNLLEACNSGKGRAMIKETAKFLENYVNKHFAHEEELQKKSNYPNFQAHHMFHENYKRKLCDIVTQIMNHESTIADVALLNTHISTLIMHIKSEDKKIGKHLESSMV